MAFLLYERKDGYLINTGKGFSLAGYNLIYKLWLKKGEPVDQGWHMCQDELIRVHTKDTGSVQTNALLIDFDPNARYRTGIIELLDIYAYTYSSETKDMVGWTPLMLRLRVVLYEEYEKNISDDAKVERIRKIKEPVDGDDFVEFLYLNGPVRGWSWGRNGMTNAAFIHGPAREYFRKYF